jgi:hypothetical protein
MPVLIFSHTRGTPKNAAERTEQLRRVADRVDVAALDLRAVEAEHPLRDVRERQVAHGPLRVREAGLLLGGDRLVEHVVVRQHDALRAAGRAGRVEDRRGGVRRQPGGARLDGTRVGGTVGRAGGDQRVPVVAEHHDPADAVDLLERLLPAGAVVPGLEERHDRAGVAGDVRHLLGRQRVVDRHRRGGRVHRAHVREEVLDPVGRHDRHGVAGPDAELHQPGGDVESALTGLGPGERAPRVTLGDMVAVGVRRLAAVLVHGVGERVHEGAPLDLRLDAGALAGDLGIHLCHGSQRRGQVGRPFGYAVRAQASGLVVVFAVLDRLPPFKPPVDLVRLRVPPFP